MRAVLRGTREVGLDEWVGSALLAVALGLAVADSCLAAYDGRAR